VQGLLQAGFWALAAASPAALSLQQALAWPAAALPAPAQAGAPAAEAVLALQQDFISPVPALEPAQAGLAAGVAGVTAGVTAGVCVPVEVVMAG